MAITKEKVVEKIEIVGKWSIQVATDTVIKEDGEEISRSRHRHVLQPYTSSYKTKEVDGVSVADLDSKGKKQWTHTDTDISKEANNVKAVVNTVWTDSVKTEYKSWIESREE